MWNTWVDEEGMGGKGETEGEEGEEALRAAEERGGGERGGGGGGDGRG